jgi:hypothetical protein
LRIFIRGAKEWNEYEEDQVLIQETIRLRPGLRLLQKGDPKMKKLALLGLLISMMAFSAPGDPTIQNFSQKTNEEAYRKALKLDPIPPGAIELELKSTIPSDKEVEEKEIYFRNFIGFSVDDRGHIYVPDAALCVVYELDLQGKLISKFNKKGQGPGEMIFPQEVFFHSQNVIVEDGPSLRMKIYDREWNYLRQFSFPLLGPIVLGREGKFICGDRTGKSLLSVMDMEGKVIGSFGDLPFPNKNISSLNNIILGVSSEGSIWVGFTALGKIRKYSPEGLLEKEIDLVEMSSSLIKKSLNNNFGYDKNNQRIHDIILWAVCFLGEDVLVTMGGLVHPIFRFSPAGSLKGVYYVKPRIEFDKKCLYAKVNNQGDEEFFLLQNDDGIENIGIYVRKK